jgi:Family of unknown function (DUF5343)
MADFPYTTVPGKIKSLLAKVREVGVPPKVTAQWLKSIGFKSSNDATLIGILKYIGLTDSSGVPTSKWNQYRGAAYKTVLGDAVREGYAELFAVYPDANQRSQADLEHVFSTSSSGGKQVVGKTVSTFKALAEQAEFSPLDEQTELHISSGPLHTPAAKAADSTGVRAASGPTLHIDVQIHISPEASAEQIDQVFASMAKHIYGGRKSD